MATKDKRYEKQIAASITFEALAALDAAAEKVGMTRAAFVRRLINLAIEKENRR